MEQPRAIELYQSQKFRDYIKTPGLVGDLKKCLIGISWSCGIAEELKPEPLAIIATGLIRQYPDFSKEELVYAFELHQSGKLDQYLEHYQKFVPEYIFKVVNLYLKFRRDQLSRWEIFQRKERERMQQERINNILKLPEHQYTEAELDQMGTEYCRSVYNIFLDLVRSAGKEHRRYEYFPEIIAVFRHIKNIGKYNLTPTEKSNFKQQVILQMRKNFVEHELKRTNAIVISFDKKLECDRLISDEKQVQYQCIKTFVIKHIKQVIANEKSKTKKAARKSQATREV